MKKIMNAIGYIIDFVVLLVQVPYMFIAGAIIGGSYIPLVGSNYMYIWFPTDGVFKLWMRPNGDLTYDLITYEELFR